MEKTEGIDGTFLPGEAYIGHTMTPVTKQVRPRGKGRKQVPVPLPDSDHEQLKEEEGMVAHDEVNLTLTFSIMYYHETSF